jgi:hypothetical protein
MTDVVCPYCGCEQYINHDDDVYGYDESQTYQQKCCECEKIFTFTTCIHFSYEVYAAPCLNDDGTQHTFNKFGLCVCGHRRSENEN